MRVAVLGAGAWGTAIACVLAARMEVALWARDAQQARALAQTRRNERYLRGIDIPAAVNVTADLAAATSGIALALAATPVAGLRDLLAKLDRRTPARLAVQGFRAGAAARCRTRSPKRWLAGRLAAARFPALRSPKRCAAACLGADARLARCRVRARRRALVHCGRILTTTSFNYFFANFFLKLI
jgi:glycerol-3-phosphate dehydrogenase (NAD(P)+)